MNDAHNELARLIMGRTTPTAVEAILAAGYRKPRQITTREELDALPIGTVLMDSDPAVVEQFLNRVWMCTGDESQFGPHKITLPATVLYIPEAGK